MRLPWPRAGSADRTTAAADAGRARLRSDFGQCVRADPEGVEPGHRVHLIARVCRRSHDRIWRRWSPRPASRHPHGSARRLRHRLRRRVSVPKITALRVEIGTRFPAARTSQGKVLLAALPEAEATAALADRSRSGLPAVSERPAAEFSESSSGFERRAGRWPIGARPGVRSIAAPVRDYYGTVRAAMNVTVHAPRPRPSICCTRTCRCCWRPPGASAASGRCGSPAPRPAGPKRLEGRPNESSEHNGQ